MRPRRIALAVALAALVLGTLALAPHFAGAPARAPSAPAVPDSSRGSSSERSTAGPASGGGATIPVVPRYDRAAQPLPAMPPVGERLVAIHERLQRQALNGDPRAACRLAFELQRCARLPGLRQFVADIRRRETEAGTPAERAGANRAARFFGGLVQRAEQACEGFPHEETANAWKWELAAALAGYPPSMARFVSGTTAGAFKPAERPDAWNAYRDHAREFLQRAVEAGEPVAFELAMHAHRRGELHGVALAQREPSLSAAYAIALSRVASPAYAAYLDLAALERELGAERYRQAGLVARMLSAKLAHVAPGTVDFTNGTQGRDDGSHCNRDPD